MYIYLPSQSFDFEVIRDFDHLNTTPAPKDSLYYSHGDTKGIITSPEEEIEEDKINSFEPEVLDLIKQVSEDSKVTKNSHPQFDPTEQGDAADNMELEFEQGLLDTYFDLFTGMDPDDNCNLKWTIVTEDMTPGSTAEPSSR
ncbi:HIT-type Zinc finger family protein [Raphanus sativus]|nr:HIT-type Zinc finger family protein [Raphanus sativus]